MIAQHSSKSNEHFSPPEVVEAARALMGGIDLDPASCEEANLVVQASKFYSKGESGLGVDWPGRVFLNPPGGLTAERESSAGVWWRELAHQHRHGVVEQAVFVGFTLELLRTAQQYFGYEPQRYHRCYPRARLKFSGAGSPTHANVLIYLPKCHGDIDFPAFKEHFSKFGFCEPGFSP